MAIAAPHVHKSLSADALFALVRKAFATLGDHRPGTPDITLSDALMSALAMFSLKAPSLLAFDKERAEDNLHRIYGIERVPCDTSMREIIDPVAPASLRPVFDSTKQVNGRKRHILVDPLGLLLAMVVTAANVQNCDGAKQLLGILRHWFTRLRCIWADGAYAGCLEIGVTLLCCYQVVRWEIVKRSDTAKSFIVLPQRWIVERTFGWFGKYDD